MERLTEKHYLGTDHYMKCSGNCNVDMDCIDCPSFDRLVECLAAYEDTGLTPEGFAAYWVFIQDLIGEQKASEALSHFRELAEADKDGRVVVLPNKPSSTTTNADLIRNATNQQLAKQIYDSQKELCRMVYKNLGFEDELNFSEDYSDILAWLNAPANTGVAKVDDDNG